MRLAYFGTSVFAVPTLERLASCIVLVVSQPDRPTGRGMKLQMSPVKQRALELGLPVETPEKCRAPEFAERIRALDLDALLVAAYGQILPISLLVSARCGAINLHGSLLPKYRGAAPIQRAILEGESTTGVTLMQMDKGMDTGDELSHIVTAIGPDETYGELQDRLAVLAADLAERDLPRVIAGSLARIPQDDERATYAPKVEKAEAELSFSRDAEGEYRRFRAFTPSPGAFLRTCFGVLKLSEVCLGSGSGRPGEVLSVSPELEVAFGGGSLVFRQIQPEGKKRMSGRDWANGHRLSASAETILRLP